jgi:hypothetical protein
MEGEMNSTNPCAIYNFYNCCDGNGLPSAGGGASSLFIWQSGNILDPGVTGAGQTQEPLRGTSILGNSPNAALKSYEGLLPLHRKAQLKEIAILRLPEYISPISATYPALIKFDLVVLDYNGVLIRQISTATLDYKLIPLMKWTPVTLSTTPGDLDVMPGEVIAGQLTFSVALPAGISVYSAIYQLSGTGVLTP